MLLSEKISLSVHSAKSVCPPPNTESQAAAAGNEGADLWRDRCVVDGSRADCLLHSGAARDEG
jgi:hypothetical protein